MIIYNTPRLTALTKKKIKLKYSKKETVKRFKNTGITI